MENLEKLAKARQELEELYMGVLDESVNLTFKDLPDLKQQNGVTERKIINVEPIQEAGNIKEGLSLPRSSRPNFSKSLQASEGHRHHVEKNDMKASRGHQHIKRDNYQPHKSPNNSRRKMGPKSTTNSYLDYDDVSGMDVASRSLLEERGGRCRPGIPHSNICTICNTYVYIFRRRCLVCGRVYCRSCVHVGMGEMTEGRKCVECLGRRFSQRYIRRAGTIGCCTKYPKMWKQQELIWAEKGPRRSGERGPNKSGMMSRSRSPITPSAHVSSTPPSFVMNSPYSAYSPTNHPIPF